MLAEVKHSTFSTTTIHIIWTILLQFLFASAQYYAMYYDQNREKSLGLNIN